MSDELREFLRSRRGRLSPAEVGLPVAGGRRRVPGLRREEVAQLAGVSVDYYVRLEQGRDLTPSESVLDALARALRLDDTERAHLIADVGRDLEVGAARGVLHARAQAVEQLDPGRLAERTEAVGDQLDQVIR